LSKWVGARADLVAIRPAFSSHVSTTMVDRKALCHPPAMAQLRWRRGWTCLDRPMGPIKGLAQPGKVIAGPGLPEAVASY
jgi:hypothetical protein